MDDECLVDIQIAETSKLTLFTFLKICMNLKNGSLLNANRQLELAHRR